MGVVERALALESGQLDSSPNFSVMGRGARMERRWRVRGWSAGGGARMERRWRGADGAQVGGRGWSAGGAQVAGPDGAQVVGV